MYDHRVRVLFLLLLAAGAAGCEAGPEEGPAPETEATAPAAAPAVDPIVATEAAAGAQLSVARTPEYGPFLADGSGRALYLLESDPQGQSTCYDACAEAWPPLLAPQGTPTAADPAVQAGLIGTIQRRDGTTQVTYGGHPLYHYAHDRGPGQATGQDVHDQWGEWYLVTPQGEPLEEHGSGTS